VAAEPPPRRVVVLGACRLCGGAVEDALPFAGAIEMIHTYSLIHDDLPCMDDDDLRRGRPTNHKVFGEANAVLAGDGLLTAAFETMLAPGQKLPPERVLEAAGILARAAGGRGMGGGQGPGLGRGGAPPHPECPWLWPQQYPQPAAAGCWCARSLPQRTVLAAQCH